MTLMLFMKAQTTSTIWLMDRKTTGKTMTRKQTTVALALMALAVSSSVAAKTLVYCSEGSP